MLAGRQQYMKMKGNETFKVAVKTLEATAREADTGGFMLWNADGVYTKQELRHGAPPPLPELPTPGL